MNGEKWELPLNEKPHPNVKGVESSSHKSHPESVFSLCWLWNHAAVSNSDVHVEYLVREIPPMERGCSSSFEDGSALGFGIAVV